MRVLRESGEILIPEVMVVVVGGLLHRALGVVLFSCVPLFWLPLKCPEVMELSAIKWTSGSSALRSHSLGYLHTQEEH